MSRWFIGLCVCWLACSGNNQSDHAESNNNQESRCKFQAPSLFLETWNPEFAPGELVAFASYQKCREWIGVTHLVLNAGTPQGKAPLPELVDGFDFPVGPPDGKRYYNAQPFGKNFHLGDDWNGIGGGNTDLGDSVFAIAHGHVELVEDFGGGWGKVIRIAHRIKDDKEETYVESLYAHLLEFGVKENHMVKRGDYIGKIGNADGAYLAHLHLEIRDTVGLPLGGGYSRNTDGYIAPSAFIKNHRPK